MHLIRVTVSGLLLLLLIFVPLLVAQDVVPAGEIDPSEQLYDFSARSRCRLLAHQSIILKTNDYHRLVWTGGFGIFLTQINDRQVHVLDLNPYTVAVDLATDFATPGVEPLWQYKRPSGVEGPPVTNHGGIWSSDDQNTIWYQGGHFYDEPGWNTSLYHLAKWQIPPWQLWQMNVSNEQQGWVDVTDNTAGHDVVNVTFAGAGVSVPGVGISVWLGGLEDPRTSALTPNGTARTTHQMLVYNHSSGDIAVQQYYGPGSANGTYEGTLVHLPIGIGSGYLMSLMSLQNPVDKPWPYVNDADENPQNVDPVTLDSIPLYDIDAGQWLQQQTSWFMGDIPEPRTRFCSALFHDEARGTWDLWVHGGQLVSDENTGVPDLYVLSMPSFIWTKIQTTLPYANLIRSHTCHAVGGQLIIVGGYPPGLQPATNASCDAEIIKVLSIEEQAVSWTGTFSTDTKYVTPQAVRDVVDQRTTPWAGFASQKLQDDFAWRPSHRSRLGGIIGGVLGGLLILTMIGVMVWRFDKRSLVREAEQAGSKYPGSPRYGAPEAMETGRGAAASLVATRGLNRHRLPGPMDVSVPDQRTDVPEDRRSFHDQTRTHGLERRSTHELSPQSLHELERRSTYELESPVAERPYLRGLF